MTAAIIAGQSSEMDFAARKMLGHVRAEAAKHTDTGHYQTTLGIATVPGRMGTGTQVSDRIVYADDDGAAAIEWGHIYRHPNSRRVTFVPGLHIMRNAIGAA